MKRLLKSTAVFLLTTIFLTSGFVPVLLADHHEKDEKAAVEKTKKKRAYPFRGKVGAVDKKAKSITLHGKEKSRTFYITEKTKIQKHGKPAKLDDAVVGEEVAGSVLPDENGKLMLNSVRFGPKPKEEKKSNKEK